MKNIVIVFLVITTLTACSTQKNVVATKNKEGDLVGTVDKNDFKKEPYASEWFNDYYSYYETDKSTVEKLKPLLRGVKIKGFLGTWCVDSQREIPNFYKILDEAGFDYSNLELIAVNRNKQAKGLEAGYNIERVPTFIFYKNKQEIGRFVEHAVDGSTIEQDFLTILSRRPYKHPYQK